MRRLLLFLALLMVAGSTFAATRLAEPGGATTGNCTVTPCTFNYAMSQVVAGDTLTAAVGVYNETVSRLTTLSGAATIIEGISSAPDEVGQTAGSTVIIDGGGAANCFTMGITNNVTFRHFTIRNCTTTLMDITGGNTTNQRNVTITDMHFDDSMGTLDGYTGASWPSNGRYDLANMLGAGQSRFMTISYSEFEGDPDGTCEAGDTNRADTGILGSCGGAIIGGANTDAGVGSGLWIHHNTFTNFQGWLVGQGVSRSIIEYNWIEMVRGRADDSMIQNYNDNGVLVRFNKFIDVCPDEVPYGYILNVRSTDNLNGNGARSAAVFYNNTVVLNSGCSVNGSTRGVWRRHSTQDEDFVPNEDMGAFNNIYVGTYGVSTSITGVLIQSTAANPQCPPNFVVGHDLWATSQSFDYAVAAAVVTACGAGAFVPAYDDDSPYEPAGYDVADPALDVNYDPEVGSPACTGGYTGFIPNDGTGTPSPQYRGASQGACAGAAGTLTSPLLGGFARGVIFP